MPIDVARPEVSKDQNGDPMVTLTATRDGAPFLTNTTTYHGMSAEHLAALGAVVERFFDRKRHTGLSDKEFGKWEDDAYEVIANFREGRKGKK